MNQSKLKLDDLPGILLEEVFLYIDLNELPNFMTLNKTIYKIINGVLFRNSLYYNYISSKKRMEDHNRIIKEYPNKIKRLIIKSDHELDLNLYTNISNLIIYLNSNDLFSRTIFRFTSFESLKKLTFVIDEKYKATMLNFASILFQVEEFELKVNGLIAISLVAEYLNPNRLKKLKIQGFAINLFGLEILQKNFQNLATLYLACIRFVIPYNFNKTKSFTSLKKLVLDGKFSRIFRLQYFGDLTNLITLKVPFKKLATLDCISNENHLKFQNLGFIDLKLIDGITVSSMSHLNKVYIKVNNELEDVILRLLKFKTVSTIVFYSDKSDENDENESITVPYFGSGNEISNMINSSTTKLVFKECYLSIEVLFNALRLFPNVTQVKFKRGQLTITDETCLTIMTYSTLFLIDYLAVNRSDINLLSKILPFSNFYLF